MFNLRKLLSNKEFILGAVIVIIAIVLFSYDGSKRSYMDGLTDGSVSPYDTTSNNVSVSQAQEVSGGDSYMSALASDKQQTSSGSLLPADSNNAFSALNPSTNLGAMTEFLQAGQHIGMSSTILRNANLQIRSDPPITMQDVGPWNQTTIEGDGNQVPLELGRL